MIGQHIFPKIFYRTIHITKSYRKNDNSHNRYFSYGDDPQVAARCTMSSSPPYHAASTRWAAAAHVVMTFPFDLVEQNSCFRGSVAGHVGSRFVGEGVAPRYRR
ncbi:hypothetical protein GWI33_022901 [Rhynchophorus ferrugineus]|uniref:Uncharacterized protein n=1 Tax=Rhynchophorus ferrugineus TaxID=354439 RepID=A0A834IML4_RHYFE|nr:hypothetical protein GWI33_022901 [Rhynchophorus ferrugineus]